MTTRKTKISTAALVIALMVLATSSLPLDAIAGIELQRGRVQAGGADHLEAGTLSLDGTIGQHEVGEIPRSIRWLLVSGFQATEVDPGLVFSCGFESGGTGEWSVVSP